jgi:hypothetical protein
MAGHACSAVSIERSPRKELLAVFNKRFSSASPSRLSDRPSGHSHIGRRSLGAGTGKRSEQKPENQEHARSIPLGAFPILARRDMSLFGFHRIYSSGAFTAISHREWIREGAADLSKIVKLCGGLSPSGAHHHPMDAVN